MFTARSKDLKNSANFTSPNNIDTTTVANSIVTYAHDLKRHLRTVKQTIKPSLQSQDLLQSLEAMQRNIESLTDLSAFLLGAKLSCKSEQRFECHQVESILTKSITKWFNHRAKVNSYIDLNTEYLNLDLYKCERTLDSMVSEFAQLDGEVGISISVCPPANQLALYFTLCYERQVDQSQVNAILSSLTWRIIESNWHSLGYVVNCTTKTKSVTISVTAN